MSIYRHDVDENIGAFLAIFGCLYPEEKLIEELAPVAAIEDMVAAVKQVRKDGHAVRFR